MKSYSFSSVELWDARAGQWLSRCKSQPFDVHAAWMPDGKHFIAGLDLKWDHLYVSPLYFSRSAVCAFCFFMDSALRCKVCLGAYTYLARVVLYDVSVRALDGIGCMTIFY